MEHYWSFQSLVTAHDKFKSTFGEADQEFRSIIGLENEIGRLIDQHGLDRELLKNPYSHLSGHELQKKWGEVQELVPKRDTQLQAEMHRQHSRFFVL